MSAIIVTSGAATTYMENRILNYLFRSASAPAFYTGSLPYFALYTGSTEISGSGYARIRPASSVWTIDSGKATLNTEVSFPAATADYGDTVNHLILISGSESGSALYDAQFPPLVPSQYDIVSVLSYVTYLTGTSEYSYYLANFLYNNLFKNASNSKIGLSVYAALYMTLPNQSDVGGIEVSASSNYARPQIAGTGNWDNPTNGSIVNKNEFVFIDYATSDIGTVTGIGIRNGAYFEVPIVPGSQETTSGPIPPPADSLFLRFELDTPIDIYEGDGIKMPADHLIFIAR